MATLSDLFVTTLYRAELGKPDLLAELDAICHSLDC